MCQTIRIHFPEDGIPRIHNREKLQPHKCNEILELKLKVMVLTSVFNFTGIYTDSYYNLS